MAEQIRQILRCSAKETLVDNDCHFKLDMLVCSHTHTHTQPFYFWNMSGTTQVSRYQKGKTRKVKANLDLLEQEIVSGSGICWAICNAYSL